MRLWRVFPYDARAAADAPGGALFVPRSMQNRASNPDLYQELYLSSHPEGAIAETFGRYPVWERETFVHPDGLPYTVVGYELPDSTPIADLDDPSLLQELRLRPRHVVTRERSVTQAWSRDLFQQHRWHGIAWWSYYDPQWTSYALWDLSALVVADAPRTLSTQHPVVQLAAHVIVRRTI